MAAVNTVSGHHGQVTLLLADYYSGETPKGMNTDDLPYSANTTHWRMRVVRPTTELSVLGQDYTQSVPGRYSWWVYCNVLHYTYDDVGYWRSGLPLRCGVKVLLYPDWITYGEDYIVGRGWIEQSETVCDVGASVTHRLVIKMSDPIKFVPNNVVGNTETL